MKARSEGGVEIMLITFPGEYAAVQPNIPSGGGVNWSLPTWMFPMWIGKPFFSYEKSTVAVYLLAVLVLLLPNVALLVLHLLPGSV